MFVFGLVLLFALSSAACAVGSGCPADKAQTVKYGRKGGVKYKQGKTGLFPKNMKR